MCLAHSLVCRLCVHVCVHLACVVFILSFSLRLARRLVFHSYALCSRLNAKWRKLLSLSVPMRHLQKLYLCVHCFCCLGPEHGFAGNEHMWCYLQCEQALRFRPILMNARPSLHPPLPYTNLDCTKCVEASCLRVNRSEREN